VVGIEQYSAVYLCVGGIFTVGERENVPLYGIAVVTEQSFVGTHPYQTLLVLNKTIDNRSIGI
jgi:hypothetical protein